MNDRKVWTQYEDESLVEVVDQIGTDNWTSVAELMNEKFGIKDRSGKKCRERWINHLKPDVSKSPWTENEMKTLFRSQAFYGNQWTEIAKFLPGRTDNSVKNFFYTTLRKKIRLYNKAAAEQDKINLSVNDVSLNPELTKKVLEVPVRREGVKAVERYSLRRRTSARIQENCKKVTRAELPKVLSEMQNCESFETACSLPSEMISFDFSKYMSQMFVVE